MRYQDPLGLALTQWDKDNLSQADQDLIVKYTNDWELARANGSQSGMAMAHQQAEAIRNKYRAAGEYGTGDGNTVNITTGTSPRIPPASGSDLYQDLPEELKMLLALIAGEALDTHNPLEYAAIAHVIFNRLANGNFPDTITAVIKQPGQFHAYNGGLYKDMMDWLNAGMPDTWPANQYSVEYWKMIVDAVIPVYNSSGANDFTEGAVYFARGRSEWCGVEVCLGMGLTHRFFLAK